jgi:hypothetical protein
METLKVFLIEAGVVLGMAGMGLVIVALISSYK